MVAWPQQDYETRIIGDLGPGVGLALEASASMHSLELRTARALLKFCEDHDYNPTGLIELRACVSALEGGRRGDALTAFSRIPLGGMGTFGDWLPPHKYANESQEYVASVFDALLFRWVYLMKQLEST